VTLLGPRVMLTGGPYHGYRRFVPQGESPAVLRQSHPGGTARYERTEERSESRDRARRGLPVYRYVGMEAAG
jgi:hypothetical protein